MFTKGSSRRAQAGITGNSYQPYVGPASKAGPACELRYHTRTILYPRKDGQTIVATHVATCLGMCPNNGLSVWYCRLLVRYSFVIVLRPSLVFVGRCTAPTVAAWSSSIVQAQENVCWMIYQMAGEFALGRSDLFEDTLVEFHCVGAPFLFERFWLH
jgi:hypothetical protein